MGNRNTNKNSWNSVLKSRIVEELGMAGKSTNELQTHSLNQLAKRQPVQNILKIIYELMK